MLPKLVALFIFILWFCSCSSVIYHLNDTDYQRMPPLFALDEYEPCLREKGGTFCVLQLTLYAEPDNQLMRMITEYSEHSSKHYNYTHIDRGICVKKTCQQYVNSIGTTEDLKRSLEVCLSDSLRREYGLNAKVSTLYYCDQRNETRYFDNWDWTVLMMVIGLVTINIVGSVYDYNIRKQANKEERNGNLILCFSVLRNWKSLSSTETNGSKMRDLQFLYGIRVITNMIIVFAHVMTGMTIGYMENPHDIEKSYENLFFQLLFNGLNVVQMFFFISGFLAIYNLLVLEKTYTIWETAKVILLRISRLIPTLVMILALTTTWVRHLSSGPLWKLLVSDSLVKDCRTKGWLHLLFLNNYQQRVSFCLIQTWHVAADMQVYLICVTAYIIANQRRVVLGVLLLLSAAASALHTLAQDLDTLIYIPKFFRTWESRTFWLQHILGHNNLPCFIIGMAIASLLHRWQKNGGHLVKNRWYSVLHYVGLAAISLFLYSGQVFFNDGERAHVLVRAAYSSSIRVLVGLACALLVSSLFTKNASYIKSFFEWRYWIVASRLTYCVYLLHMIVIHVMFGAITQLTYFSFYELIKTNFVILAMSYLGSVPLFLMVEAPFTKLFKNLALNKNVTKKQY